VLSYPNKKLAEDQRQAEEDRIEANLVSMGEEGVKAAKQELEMALASQELPPDDVLLSMPVANVDGIVFRRLDYRNRTIGLLPGFDPSIVPYRVHLDDVDSRFVRYYLAFNASSVAEADRPWLVLLTSSWLRNPIRTAEGKLLSAPEVSNMRNRELLTLDVDLGYKGSTFSAGAQSENVFFYAESLLVSKIAA